MLPKLKKLTRGTYPDGRNKKFMWNGTILRIQAFREGDHTHPLFAVTVPKKYLKLANERNTFKRTIYSLIEHTVEIYAHHNYGKFVFSPKTVLKGVDKELIRSEMLLFQSSLKTG